LRVVEVMRRELVTVAPELGLPDLEERLLRARISGAPVVEDGRVVGVVSRSDVVRQLDLERSRFAAASSFYLEPFDVEAEGARDRRRVPEAVAARLESLRVGDVMIRDVIHVAPSASLAEAARLMVERRVHRVLVLEQDRLQGLLTALDLARLVADGRLVDGNSR
jgi:CBS domain-containing protein